MSFIVEGIDIPTGCPHCPFEFCENGVHKCRVVYHGITEEIHELSPYYGNGRLKDCPIREIQDKKEGDAK